MTEPNALFTSEQREQLAANWRATLPADPRNEPNDLDPRPVVRLFTPDAHAVWLLTELDEANGLAFGLCGAPHNPNYVKHTVMRSAACQCSHDVVTGRHYSA